MRGEDCFGLRVVDWKMYGIFFFVTEFVFDRKNRETSRLVRPGGEIPAPGSTNQPMSRREYDDWDRLKSETNPLSQTTRYFYWEGEGSGGVPTEKIERVVLPSLHEQRVVYDALGRVLQEIDPMLERMVYASVANPFNPFHQPTMVLDKDGVATWFEYYNNPADLLTNRAGLVKTVKRGGTSFANAQEVTSFDYDVHGRPVKTYYGPRSRGKFEERTFNAWGDVISVKSVGGGSLTSFSYNSRRDLLRVASGTNATSYTYNSAGNITATIQKISSTLNAVARADYSPSNQVTLQTDPTKLKTVYEYDHRDYLKRQYQDIGGVAKFETITMFDVLGRATTVKDPLGRKSDSDSFDLLNRPLRTYTRYKNEGERDKFSASTFEDILKTSPESERGLYASRVIS